MCISKNKDIVKIRKLLLVQLMYMFFRDFASCPRDVLHQPQVTSARAGIQLPSLSQSLKLPGFLWVDTERTLACLQVVHLIDGA